MKTLSLFTVILVFVLLGALAAGGYLAVRALLDFFGALAPQTALIATLASAMALLSATLIIRGFARSPKQAKARMHIEKAHLYERVLLIWGEKLKSTAASTDPSVEGELRQLAQLLTLRGSPRVIKAYVELQGLENSRDIPSRVARLTVEMRKDLGLSTQTLKAEDFLKLVFPHANAAHESGKTQQQQDIEPRVSLAANP